MNWFNIVNFILALAPQEVALVKAIVDAAHAGHQAGTPLQPVPLPIVPAPPAWTPQTSQDAQATLAHIVQNVPLTGQSGAPLSFTTTQTATSVEQKETPSAVVEPPANGVKKTL